MYQHQPDNKGLFYRVTPSPWVLLPSHVAALCHQSSTRCSAQESTGSPVRRPTAHLAMGGDVGHVLLLLLRDNTQSQGAPSASHPDHGLLVCCPPPPPGLVWGEDPTLPPSLCAGRSADSAAIELWLSTAGPTRGVTPIPVQPMRAAWPKLWCLIHLSIAPQRRWHRNSMVCLWDGLSAC